LNKFVSRTAVGDLLYVDVMVAMLPASNWTSRPAAWIQYSIQKHWRQSSNDKWFIEDLPTCALHLI